METKTTYQIQHCTNVEKPVWLDRIGYEFSKENVSAAIAALQDVKTAYRSQKDMGFRLVLKVVEITPLMF